MAEFYVAWTQAGEHKRHHMQADTVPILGGFLIMPGHGRLVLRVERVAIAEGCVTVVRGVVACDEERDEVLSLFPEIKEGGAE